MDGGRLKNPDLVLSGFCDKLLVGHLGDRTRPGSRVLDLGGGTGANGLYFAKAGCRVEIVDISREALEQCRLHAQNLEIEVSTTLADARQIELSPESYDLIIVSFLLQFVSRSEARQIITKCVQALKPDGDIYISTFSVHEELLKTLNYEANQSSAAVQKLDDHTCRLESGRILSFQTAAELKDSCAGLVCRYFFEGTELDESHGSPHYHSFLAFIGRKPAA